MKKLYFILLILISSKCPSQTLLEDFEYSGLPGDIYSNSAFVSPGTKLRIAYCTLNVPDSLILTMCDQKISFYIGNNPWPGLLHGFLYYRFGKNGLEYVNNIVPSGFDSWGGSLCFQYGGTVLIDVEIPENCCDFSWRIVGNCCDYTVYSLKIWNLYSPPIHAIDTVYTYSCDRGYSEYSGAGCSPILYVYADSSIKATFLTRNPMCADNGFIICKEHPELNQYNLPQGNYHFEISNSVCSKFFDITLFDSTACEIYTPNVFSPNDDGINDIWFIGCDKDLPYDLCIYDRWGELLHYGTYIANGPYGWDGYFKNVPCNPGVYVFVVKIKTSEHITLRGDVTLIR